jgi:prophage tail gpP-like protein
LLELRVNGQTFRRFKSAGGVFSNDTFAGEFSITTSPAPNNNSFLKLNDFVEIFLDGIQKHSGYLESVEDSESKTGHDIKFVGRDSVSDLIDSSVPENVKSLEGVLKFSELVQLCIDGLGLTDQIKVIDEVGATFGDSDKLKAASTGQTCGEFLSDNARIVQVFLNTDGRGNVLIRRAGGRLKTTLQLVDGAINNNIKSSNFKLDLKDRFYKYVIYSNSSLTSDSATINDLNNKGEAFDNEIRKSKVFEKISDKPMTSDQCKSAAEEEANIRRGRSFSYDCDIAGFSANGELWEPGLLVPVKDDERGVKGIFQTSTVRWSWSGSGEVVNIAITYPDKGLVEPDLSPALEKTTQGSSTYTVVKDDTLSQIAVDFGVKLSDLVAVNPQIENIDLIYPGQGINIPVESISQDQSETLITRGSKSARETR